MQDSHHVNQNSIIYRKGEVHRSEIERPCLAAMGFNTNLVHFLPPHHIILINVHGCSFTGAISHVHKHAPKTVLRAKILCTKSYNFGKPGTTRSEGICSNKFL